MLPPRPGNQTKSRGVPLTGSAECSERISVTYMVTFDATAPKPATSNIRRLTNFYSKEHGWGVPVKRGAGFRGVLKNVDLSNNKKVNHTNIDDRPNLQDQVVRNILRFL